MLVFTSVEVLLDRRVTGLFEPGEQFGRGRGSCGQVGPQFAVVCHRVQLCRGRVRVECAPGHRGKINIAARLGRGLRLGRRLRGRSYRFGCSGLWLLRSILLCGATAGGRLLSFAIALASTLFSGLLFGRLLIARVRLGVASRLLGRVAVAVLAVLAVLVLLVLLARILLTVLARLTELVLLTPALLISRWLTVLVLLLTEVSLRRLVLLAVLLGCILLAVLVLLGCTLLAILLRALLAPALLISGLLTLLAVLLSRILLAVLVLLIGRAVLLRARLTPVLLAGSRLAMLAIVLLLTELVLLTIVTLAVLALRLAELAGLTLLAEVALTELALLLTTGVLQLQR